MSTKLIVLKIRNENANINKFTFAKNIKQKNLQNSSRKQNNQQLCKFQCKQMGKCNVIDVAILHTELFF